MNYSKSRYSILHSLFIGGNNTFLQKNYYFSLSTEIKEEKKNLNETY